MNKYKLMILTFFLLMHSAWSNFLPKNWKKMEVESKWSIDRSQYLKLIEDFSDGANFENYDLKVRWGGNTAKFVDDYYDFENDELTRVGHALRHRTRYSLEDSNPSFEWESLQNSDWDKDWERIQYKSTPYREGAIWFRFESGDCLIWSEKGTSKKKRCRKKKRKGDYRDYLYGDKKHDAIEALFSDHGNKNLEELVQVMRVTDYRYRVEFYESGDLKFELSLDQLQQKDYRTDEVTFYYEAELEILENKLDEDTLNKLRSMVYKIQNRYFLEPSTHSKSGIFVEEVLQ